MENSPFILVCNKIIQRVWPLFLGVVFIMGVFFIPNIVRNKLIWLCFLPVLTAFGVIAVQGEDVWFLPLVGLLVGGAFGIFIGLRFGPFFSKIIYGEISAEYKIRLDLLILWFWSGGFFASLFSIFGGWLGRCWFKKK